MHLEIELGGASLKPEMYPPRMYYVPVRCVSPGPSFSVPGPADQGARSRKKLRRSVPGRAGRKHAAWGRPSDLGHLYPTSAHVPGPLPKM